MCNVADIFLGAYTSNEEYMYTSASGHIVHCSAFMRYIYQHSCLICAHEVIGIYGI